MKSSFRSLVALLLAVTFLAGPMQLAFASPMSSQCVVEQTGAGSSGCCDEALHEFPCGFACPMSGQAWMTLAVCHLSSQDRAVALPAPPASRPLSAARPPDTAPPKLLSA
ncbi:MAG TPA: hypothetical protein VFX67_00475 [Burkholderiales bacterium]|nr:hypothetical protein [Burkholderiales bacterium]